MLAAGGCPGCAGVLPHRLEGLGGGSLISIILPDSSVRVGAGLQVLAVGALVICTAMQPQPSVLPVAQLVWQSQLDTGQRHSPQQLAGGRVSCWHVCEALRAHLRTRGLQC